MLGIENIVIDIVFYTVLLNIMYSLILSENSYQKNVIVYIIAMELKFFITSNEITLTTVFVSLAVYLILSLIIVKILNNIANYNRKISFIISSMLVCIMAELLLGRILYIALYKIVSAIMFVIGFFIMTVLMMFE